MIKATPADASRIMAFLLARATVAMFAITNLRDHGMAGGHPKAMTFWINDENGQITDVLGLSESGIVLPVFTSAYVDVRGALAGQSIMGVIGQNTPVQSVKEQLGLPLGDLDRVEPHFELALDALQMPANEGFSILPVAAVARETLIVWRTQYGIDALNLEPTEAAVQANGAIDAMVANDSHRVLMAGDTPVAMTGFNAVLSETVMVGGVYTPAAARGKGYAKVALALHLADAHLKGVKRAVLSAANVSAARAYSAIGFRQVGEFGLVMYHNPQVAHV